MAIFDKVLRVYYLPVIVIAWLGGAAFAGSLGYLAYFYLVTLHSTAGDPAQALGNTLINVALFSAFALHHSLFARRGMKQAIAAALPPTLERVVYVWIASLLLLVMCAAWRPVAGLVYEMTGSWRLAGWAVQIAGIAIVVRAARVINPFELAGIHQAAGRQTPSALRIIGPFRRVRHPIYLGWMLMVFGTPFMTLNRLLFALVSSAYLILAIPWEERSLVAAHGDQYRDYQQAVRWRVVPGIW